MKWNIYEPGRPHLRRETHGPTVRTVAVELWPWLSGSQTKGLKHDECYVTYALAEIPISCARKITIMARHHGDRDKFHGVRLKTFKQSRETNAMKIDLSSIKKSKNRQQKSTINFHAIPITACVVHRAAAGPAAAPCQ